MTTKKIIAAYAWGRTAALAGTRFAEASARYEHWDEELGAFLRGYLAHLDADVTCL